MSTVLVTGCSSGIGLETALAFARNGDTTIATMRDPTKAGRLLGRAADEGLTVHVESLDVCDAESVDETVAAVLHNHGGIDVLVNNAGVTSAGPVETQSLDVAMRLMDTNFWGPLRTMRAVLPAMRDVGSGVIVNVSSLASRLPAGPYSGMYAASKQALNAISEALTGEVERFGIRVVLIEPGFFSTDIIHNNLSRDEQRHDAYRMDQQWFRSFNEKSAEAGAHAGIVADAIVAAARNPTTPLHRPVGDDAANYLELFRQVGSYEGWMNAVLPILETNIGARPTAG